VDIRQAEAAVSTIARRLQQAYPRENRAFGIAVGPYHALGAGPARRDTARLMAMLSAATGLVLLVACANFAGLLLVRASARGREVAIRLALGASRSRILVQFLAEALVLSMIGCAAALLVAAWSGGVLAGLFPLSEGTPPALDLTPDFSLVVYALGLALFCTLTTAGVPLILASKPDWTSALKTGETVFVPLTHSWRPSASCWCR